MDHFGNNHFSGFGVLKSGNQTELSPRVTYLVKRKPKAVGMAQLGAAVMRGEMFREENIFPQGL